MKSKCFLFSLLIVGVLSAATTSTARLIGGYDPIKDPNDPYVVEIAKFAVSQHDKDAATNLVFVNVLSGEQQVVAGMNYKLNIKANSPEENEGDVYQAIVYDKPWEKYRSLTSFTKVDHKNN